MDTFIFSKFLYFDDINPIKSTIPFNNHIFTIFTLIDVDFFSLVSNYFFDPFAFHLVCTFLFVCNICILFYLAILIITLKYYIVLDLIYTLK